MRLRQILLQVLIVASATAANTCYQYSAPCCLVCWLHICDVGAVNWGGVYRDCRCLWTGLDNFGLSGAKNNGNPTAAKANTPTTATPQLHCESYAAHVGPACRAIIVAGAAGAGRGTRDHSVMHGEAMQGGNSTGPGDTPSQL